MLLDPSGVDGGSAVGEAKHFVCVALQLDGLRTKHLADLFVGVRDGRKLGVLLHDCIQLMLAPDRDAIKRPRVEPWMTFWSCC